MFNHILVELLYAILINFAVICEVGDKSGQAILSLEDIDLILKGLYLFADELRDINGFLLIVHI